MVRTALRLPTRRLQAMAIAGVIALAAPAMAAAAQAGPGEKSASGPAAAKPGDVGGVVVQGQRGRSKLSAIPPDKKAAFDHEAAKSEAWKKYRKSTPPAAAGTLGQSKDYPGAHVLVPH